MSQTSGLTNSDISGFLDQIGPIPIPAPLSTDGYTFCAGENGTCSFNGTAYVIYGANSTFKLLTFTDGVACSNNVFGDPIGGVSKACYFQLISSPSVNVAAGIQPTASADFFYPSFITDGNKDSNYYMDSNPNNNLQWVKLDLGASFDINQIKLWHYYGDARSYHDVIVQLSNTADFSSGVTTVFNNDIDQTAGQGTSTDIEYVETSEGKRISFNTVNARYVRIWSNGNSINSSNHYVEVEAWATLP